ncbi:MAG: transglutaminase-like domain-containing protein [Verrucomicrobiae bacterium]|nr:transglutaminase-like domain-containing protein [Verrucomicrobiae bacterium]MDW7979303.1 transglutaminase-like domain-containing protein [Verrucomicrobiales bacterium]
MNPSAEARAAAQLSDTQKAALISLLADDDPAVYISVRQQLLSFGPVVRDWLRPYLISNDPVLRRRAAQIIEQLGRQLADTRFLSFCLRSGEDPDLEQGAWLLAQTRYPEVNVEAYRALLDEYALRLHERVVFAHGARGVLTVINQYLFEKLGFAGDEENYYDPDNTYLNKVIDRRKGNPVSLCVLYMLIARRLHLPVTGIGLPGHFVCRFQTSCEEIYIDCFNRGKFMTRADCIHYLVRGKYNLHEEYLVPLTPRRLLLRMCGNLHRSYFHLEQAEEAKRVHRYLVALAS